MQRDARQIGGVEKVMVTHSEPIVRRKLSDEVFARLKRMIESGELQPGDEMPSERTLMERFQVGRPAIREAMQALANMGLVEISHGERAKVLQLTAHSLLRQVDVAAKIMLAGSSDSLEHLKSARIFFELGMVREAAARAKPADIAALEETLARQKDCLGDSEAFINADMAFHTQIARISGNPISRNLAREALRLVGRHIRTAVFNGADREARGGMLLGSMLAGQAFANSPVAAVHALAYPIGGHFHVPHGLSNALVLPHVLRFNLPQAASLYAEIAADAFPVLADVPAADRAGAFADCLAALAAELGLPTRLRDVGIEESALQRLAADAMRQTRLLVNNPRPLEEADALAIYRAAF